MTAAAGETLVRFEDVAKRFGDKVVFDGLDLEVRRGETLALLGRSGAGKSVLLRHLLGLVRPDRGRVWLDGEDLTRLTERRWVSVRRRMGMVFQSGALFDSLTVGENVAYALREHRGWREEQIRARVAECLALVDLPGIEDLPPGALSGGMRKRVAVARAIAPAPELLLYDEPTTGLDPMTARRVNDLIVSLRARLGVTSIIVTHDMSTVVVAADRVAVLEDGRVAWVGTRDESLADRPPALARVIGVGEKEHAWHPPVG